MSAQTTGPVSDVPDETRAARWRAAIDVPDEFSGSRTRECMALADAESATLRARVAVLEQQIAAIKAAVDRVGLSDSNRIANVHVILAGSPS